MGRMGQDRGKPVPDQGVNPMHFARRPEPHASKGPPVTSDDFAHARQPQGQEEPVADQNPPWHGTASLAQDTSHQRPADDNLSMPVRMEPLLKNALDTMLAYMTRSRLARSRPKQERRDG